MEFESYKDRKIAFVNNHTIDDICIKVYTITNQEHFESTKTLNVAVATLPKWLQNVKTSSIPTHRNAFLIVHEAREGVIILLSWFTGENMIETNIYYSDFKKPSVINESLYKEKQLVCVWELEIFWHERKIWIEHVLLKADNPDFKSYQNSYYIQ